MREVAVRVYKLQLCNNNEVFQRENFHAIYFKLLYIDNHSKDLLAEINFLVWRPYCMPY